MEDEVGDDITLAKQVAHVEDFLTEYETRLYLDKITLREVDLSMTRETLLHMYSEDLYGLAWDYAQYSLALAKETNKMISRLNWTESNLERYLDKVTNDYEGFGWKERRAVAMNDSTYCQKLHQLKQKTKLHTDRLAGLSQKVDFLAKLAKDIAYVKRQEESHRDEG